MVMKEKIEGEKGNERGSCDVMGLTKNEKKSSSSYSSSSSPCAGLKAAYHVCFNRWYADKFLKGEWDKEGCVSEWKLYRACLSENLNDKHLSRFLESSDLGNQLQPVDDKHLS